MTKIKAYTKGAKRKAKIKPHQQPEPRDTAIRPTAERLSRGSWTQPTGMGKHERPVHDAASDVVGRLYCDKLLTLDQHDAARDAQEAWTAYTLEIGVSTGRSCLDIGQPGYDAGDGNADVIRRWREMTRRLNSWQYGALVHTACMDHPPGNMRLLCDALEILVIVKKGLERRSKIA